jgi:hypothetical protein
MAPGNSNSEETCSPLMRYLYINSRSQVTSKPDTCHNAYRIAPDRKPMPFVRAIRRIFCRGMAQRRVKGGHVVAHDRKTLAGTSPRGDRVGLCFVAQSLRSRWPAFRIRGRPESLRLDYLPPVAIVPQLCLRLTISRSAQAGSRHQSQRRLRQQYRPQQARHGR